MNYPEYKSDCRYFKGYIPCKPHKETGQHCDDCNYYEKVDENILIIKLGAIGDVIRTTPLLSPIKKDHHNAKIWWLTYSPDVVPSFVDRILKFNEESITILRSIDFDIIINLDKDDHASALASQLRAKKKMGFVMKNGISKPADDNAYHKYMTGLFDDVNQENDKNYMEEMFEICGYSYSGEEYIIEYDKNKKWDLPTDKKIIGLNTGCGARWVSRLWPEKSWVQLVNMIQNSGYYPLLLGGPDEHERNQSIRNQSGADYLGYFPLKDFVSLMASCDMVVTAVTMGLHIAIGAKVPVVLMNNIFNSNEFELYGRGEIVEPDKECTCFFSPKCKNPDYFCLDHLPPDKIMEAIKRNI